LHVWNNRGGRYGWTGFGNSHEKVAASVRARIEMDRPRDSRDSLGAVGHGEQRLPNRDLAADYLEGACVPVAGAKDVSGLLKKEH
jgi:hypothetical protein